MRDLVIAGLKRLEVIENAAPKSKYSEAQLTKAFDRVKDKSDWKNPVKATLSAKADLDLYAASIAHFTGTYAEFRKLERTVYSKSGSRVVHDGWEVTAPGYYMMGETT